MPKLTDDIIEAAIFGLEARKQGIDTQIVELRAMMPGAHAVHTNGSSPKKRGRFSPATLQRMRKAQQLRWAKVRGESAPVSESKPKRKMSAAGKAAIIAATKRRWAKVRAEARKAGK